MHSLRTAAVEESDSVRINRDANQRRPVIFSVIPLYDIHQARENV